MEETQHIAQFISQKQKEIDFKVDSFETHFSSPVFKEKEDFINILFDSKPTTPVNKLPDLETIVTSTENLRSFKPESLKIQSWKNIENLPGRLIEILEDTVILECLIDRENKEYEEKVFRASLFGNDQLKIGNIFFLRFFERCNEAKLEIHFVNDNTFDNDFPKVDFNTLLKESKLFK